MAPEEPQGDLFDILEQLAEMSNSTEITWDIPENSSTSIKAQSLREQFEEFDRENPAVYKMLVYLTREYIRQTGSHRLGIARPWEIVRWMSDVRTNSVPKINNNFRAFYARAIMRREEDLVDVFETRTSYADQQPPACDRTTCTPDNRCPEHKDADPVILGDLLAEHAPERPECRPDPRSPRRKP